MNPNLPQIWVLPARNLNKPRPDYMMLPGEREIITALLRTISAQTVTEIGVHEGHTAEVLLLNVPTITHYVGVDVEPGYTTSKPSQQTEVPLQPGKLVTHDSRFELIIKPRGSQDLTPEDLPTSDAMIIDGDHGWEALTWDILLAYARTRPGGLIIYHDYFTGEGPLDVKDVLNERAARGTKIYHVQGTWLAVEQLP